MRSRGFWFICLSFLFLTRSLSLPHITFHVKGGFSDDIPITSHGPKKWAEKFQLHVTVTAFPSFYRCFRTFQFHSFIERHTHYYGLFGYICSARIRNIQGCRWGVDWQPRLGFVSLWLRLILSATPALDTTSTAASTYYSTRSTASSGWHSRCCFRLVWNSVLNLLFERSKSQVQFTFCFVCFDLILLYTYAC